MIARHPRARMRAHPAEVSLDVARNKPLDFAQDKTLGFARDKPLDFARDKP